MISPAFSIHVHADDLVEQISALPPSSGIYVLQAPQKPAHLSWCPNLRKRITRLLDPSYTLLRTVQASLARIECWPTNSKLESMLLMHRLAKQHFPHNYMEKTRLRLPTFLSLLDGSGFPRLAAIREPSRKEAQSAVWGPFPSRHAAELYEEEVSGLFQLRRCIEVLVPYPEHPGCIYGEMNQCLRPCQVGVSKEEYSSEATRVREFLETNGKTTVTALSEARSRACEETDFEGAAQIHKRLERVGAAIAARDPVVEELHHFNGVALTNGSTAEEWKLWPMHAARWQPPVLLHVGMTGARSKPLDVEIRERLSERFAQPSEEGKQAEDLAIFSRWYFSSWRQGEWFAFRDLKNLNYRKLVRELSKMAKLATL